MSTLTMEQSTQALSSKGDRPSKNLVLLRLGSMSKAFRRRTEAAARVRRDDQLLLNAKQAFNDPSNYSGGLNELFALCDLDAGTCQLAVLHGGWQDYCLSRLGKNCDVVDWLRNVGADLHGQLSGLVLDAAMPTDQVETYQVNSRHARRLRRLFDTISA